MTKTQNLEMENKEVADMVIAMRGDSDPEDSECEEEVKVVEKTKKTKKKPKAKVKEVKEVKEIKETVNNYTKLKTFNYGDDVFTETVEIIDTDKLAFIVNNKDIFEPLLREDRRFKGEEFEYYDPFLMARNYLEKSRRGQVKVLYKQKKGVGRKYAIKSMSLQNITRQIRQAICQDYYIDIDMKNAHPNLLKFACDNLGISCPILSKYCADRDKFFRDNGVSKAVGKIVFLAVMNGGSAEFKKIEKPSEDLLEFYTTEIKNIHDIIAYKHNDLFVKHKEKRIANDINYNHKASFMNHMLCDIENKVLDVMWEFLGTPKDAVLCFDGIMLKQGIDYDIKGCEQAIYNKLKIKIQLDIKPFEDAFDLSPYEIPKYNELKLDYYPDFRNLVGKELYPEWVNEWKNNALVLVENGGKSFFLTKNRAIDSLTKEERVYYKQVKVEEIIGNLKVKCKIINPKFDYLFWKDFQSKKPTERKELMQIMSDDEKLKLIKYTFEKLNGYVGDALENRDINSFNSVEFAPYLERNGKPTLYDSFNTFTGFPMERVELKEVINFEESRLYKHLKEEMMDGNEGEFNHFLDHIADMIQDPMNIKTNGHLFYTKQGMGKGMLAEFVGRLIGCDHAISFENTEAYFGKFNADQQNKLLKIFEEVSDKGCAFQNHDRLKGDQAKKNERVEPKGIDPYSIRHCARFWYFTNNENALFIEGDDRRFTCHRANNRYANNIEYFKGIWEEVKDLNFCKNAFEFFATRKYEIRNAYECYDTKFKKEQKQSNLPNGLKYLRELIEDSFGDLMMDGDKVKAKVLGDHFRDWCSSNGIRFNIGTFKTQLKKLDIIDKSVRFNGVKAKCYTLNKDELEVKFAGFLKDPEFKFDMVADNEEELGEIREQHRRGIMYGLPFDDED